MFLLFLVVISVIDSSKRNNRADNNSITKNKPKTRGKYVKESDQPKNKNSKATNGAGSNGIVHASDSETSDVEQKTLNTTKAPSPQSECSDDQSDKLEIDLDAISEDDDKIKQNSDSANTKTNKEKTSNDPKSSENKKKSCKKRVNINEDDRQKGKSDIEAAQCCVSQTNLQQSTNTAPPCQEMPPSNTRCENGSMSEKSHHQSKESYIHKLKRRSTTPVVQKQIQSSPVHDENVPHDHAYHNSFSENVEKRKHNDDPRMQVSGLRAPPYGTSSYDGAAHSPQMREYNGSNMPISTAPHAYHGNRLQVQENISNENISKYYTSVQHNQISLENKETPWPIKNAPVSSDYEISTGRVSNGWGLSSEDRELWLIEIHSKDYCYKNPEYSPWKFLVTCVKFYGDADGYEVISHDHRLDINSKFTVDRNEKMLALFVMLRDDYPGHPNMQIFILMQKCYHGTRQYIQPLTSHHKRIIVGDDGFLVKFNLSVEKLTTDNSHNALAVYFTFPLEHGIETFFKRTFIISHCGQKIKLNFIDATQERIKFRPFQYFHEYMTREEIETSGPIMEHKDPRTLRMCQMGDHPSKTSWNQPPTMWSDTYSNAYETNNKRKYSHSPPVNRETERYTDSFVPHSSFESSNGSSNCTPIHNMSQPNHDKRYMSVKQQYLARIFNLTPQNSVLLKKIID